MYKMYKERIFFLFLQFRFALLYTHQKPVEHTIWPERCSKNERILNDCNYCVCNINQQFICTARVCNEVDMFGHFKDTIAELNVGMEGRGSWRSIQKACQPNVHYRRNDLLCVCDEDGNWPNPVCRDIFRVLHEVQVTGRNHPSDHFKCAYSKLYLFGCNVCFCPESERIDPKLCTKNNCTNSDIVFKSSDFDTFDKDEAEFNLTEVYAQCQLDRKYILGCKKCVCLKNNRLICDAKCRDDLRVGESGVPDLCSKRKPNEIFYSDCNVCACDKNGIVYCTTKKCLKEFNKPLVELSKTVDLNLRTVDPPLDGFECVPGTKYKDDCNTCFCTENSDKVKILSCTKVGCSKRKRMNINKLKMDCVENTVYEVNCLICRCDAVDGVKRESCEVNPKCIQKSLNMESRSGDLSILHGYCEPYHVYKKDCNTCRCLPDGKIAGCTARICPDVEKPIIVDIVPVSQKGGVACVKDHMYKVDCNFCFCLSDGNILCTTAKCFD